MQRNVKQRFSVLVIIGGVLAIVGSAVESIWLRPLRTVAWIEGIGGLVEFRPVDNHGMDVLDKYLNARDWLPRCFQYSVQRVYLDHTAITDEQLANVATLRDLRELSLSETGIDGSGLRHLKNMASLVSLNLSNSSINDSSLSHLRALGLTLLNLSDTKITDNGLQHLKGQRLAYIGLARTQVTDAGLAQLSPCYLSLDVRETQVSKTFIEKAERSRPIAYVLHD